MGKGKGKGSGGNSVSRHECLGLVRADAVESNRVSRNGLDDVNISSVRYIFCISDNPIHRSVLD